MDNPVNQSSFKKYLKPTLITLAVIVVIGFSLYLLGVSFNLIIFQRLYSYLVTKIVGVTGISQWLVKGIVILILIPVLWVIPNLFVSKYRKPAIVIGLLYFSVFFLSMFFLSKDVNFSHFGQETLKWYALTPEGVKLYDSPGTDPVYGIKLKPVTPDIIQKLKLLQKGEFKPIDPENVQFFNPITGEAQVWFYQYPDGTYEFYDKPGFHPATGEALKPVTKQIYLEWRKNHNKSTHTLQEAVNSKQLSQKDVDLRNKKISIVVNPSLYDVNERKMNKWQKLFQVVNESNAIIEEYGEKTSFSQYDIIIWDTCSKKENELLFPHINYLLNAGKFIIISGSNACVSSLKRGQDGKPVYGPDGKLVDAIYSTDNANTVLKKYGMELTHDDPKNIEAVFVGEHPITKSLKSILMYRAPTITIYDTNKVKVIAKSAKGIQLALYEDPQTKGSILAHGLEFNFLFGVYDETKGLEHRDYRSLELLKNIINYQRYK